MMVVVSVLGVLIAAAVTADNGDDGRLRRP